MTALLDVSHLRISFGGDEIVRDLSFSIRPGESYGLVGESGSGKSSVANAIIGGLPRQARATGKVIYNGQDLLTASASDLRALRGARIGFVQQDPGASLNPTMRIGRQLIETLERSGMPRSARIEAAATMLTRVGFDNAYHIMERYSHQISGGQQQRIMIAMALLPQPDLILMDEPTSGLDVTVEAAVVDLIGDLRRSFGTSLLFISHNLHLVSKACDRVGVLYAGDLAEQAPAAHIFEAPHHPYTQGLVRCLPGQSPVLKPIRGHVPAPRERGAGCLFASRCDYAVPAVCNAPQHPHQTADGHAVLCGRWNEIPSFEIPKAFHRTSDISLGKPILELDHLVKSFGARNRPALVVTKDISLQVRESEILGLVGESGSGKSTIAKMVGGFETATAGRILIDNEDIGHQPVRRRKDALLRKIQMVFQNPDSTLNPSHTVGWTLARSVRRLGEGRTDRRQVKARVVELLRLVALLPEITHRRPRALSGGQRQRVAIARALAADPKVLIADEAVSALDVSVQASIIQLLQDVRRKTGTAIVFISHDLALVRQISDRIVVLFGGKPMEIGDAEQVHQRPFHPYTEALLSAQQAEALQKRAAAATASSGEGGCPYAGRCARIIGEICRTTAPTYQQAASGHEIYCHIPPARLLELQAGAGTSGAAAMRD